MTTIAMVTLTQAGATLLAIIIAAILAATASVANTPPGSTHGRRCFRATTAAGAGEAVSNCRRRVLLLYLRYLR